MSGRLLKNKSYRKLYSRLEIEILAFRYLLRTQKLPFSLRWLASVYLSDYRFVYRSKLANRCFLTNRRRGFVRFGGLSRQQMRLLARNGDLPYISKSSW